TVRSIDDCTTAFKPRCLVQSSSENDKELILTEASQKRAFVRGAATPQAYRALISEFLSDS
ncbi:hypothetical protein ACV1D2_22235, partial [Aeromonas caviae]